MENLCEFEATVVTGFEKVAAEEVKEKFDVDSIVERGCIQFTIPVSKAKEVVLDLQSIDNVFIIINHFRDFKFANTTIDNCQQFKELIPNIDWKRAIELWSLFHSFPHPIDHNPAPGWEERIKIKPPLDYRCSDEDNKSFDKTKPKFRGTCFRAAYKMKHNFQSTDLQKFFGGGIHDYFNWNVDLKNFDIDCVLFVQDDHVYVGVGVTKSSLHKRHLIAFTSTSLRSTIGYNMCRLCHIQPGEVVCDPMCGGGSIPIEACLNWQENIHLCGDIDEKLLSKSLTNLENAGVIHKMSIHKWDVTALPLKDNFVDVFVTDMPFGKRSGSKRNNWELYPKALTEMARVCKQESGRACLLTQDKKCMLHTLSKLSHLWKRCQTIGVNVGGLAAAVYFLRRL
ncbi:DgyrCDS13157 [Dimorphilus gyrociliatus]|uniref:DgyrCDS13157 n=1 Tax=Dimorphilus gyrociliatus TaxID=2664684 RepID=A0A7I8W9U3_9ANNE|nr:DgyrCDS13157 [Dimorphilus gyrociliatus]